MDAADHHPKFWSSTQTYGMAAICLILGVVVGYLVHAPAVASSNTSTAVFAPPPSTPASMPSAQDLKRMADKQVAPLVAELQKRPKDADLLTRIGSAYLAAQQYQSAQQYLEQAAGVKASPEILNELSFVQYSLGNVDQAIETLNRALKQDPRNSKLLYNLGMYQWHGKSDPKAAIAAWQSFLKANPGDPKRAQVEQMIAQAKQHLTIAPGTKTDKPVM
ncbi:MAG TPA: tetratricopeptide repeat protein [Candidatus Sulfotelmatobacter sp.]